MDIDTMTLQQAKDQLREVMHKGAKCPCCTQNVRMYERPLTSSMAYGLILMYRAEKEHPGAWIHIEDYFKKLDVPSSIRGDLPKLRFWNLLRTQGDAAEDGNPNNGLYGLTEAGNQFVELKIVVPSHIKLFNNRCFGLGTKAKDINISEALKRKFDYLELMK